MGELDRVRLTLGQELSVGRLHRLLRSLAVHRAVGVPLYQGQGARLQVCGVAILAAAAAQGTVSGPGAGAPALYGPPLSVGPDRHQGPGQPARTRWRRYWAPPVKKLPRPTDRDAWAREAAST